jgi:hypothetical protein
VVLTGDELDAVVAGLAGGEITQWFGHGGAEGELAAVDAVDGALGSPGVIRRRTGQVWPSS